MIILSQDYTCTLQKRFYSHTNVVPTVTVKSTLKRNALQMKANMTDQLLSRPSN